MRRIIVLFAIIIVSISCMTASDHLVLKSGREVTGFISCQIPGKQIIFQSDDQTLVYDISDVVRIKKDMRESELIIGMNDMIETRAGTIFRGQIIVQELGKWIQISTGSGIQTVQNRDIRRQRKELLNPRYSMFEQAAYIDVVQTDDNREYSGIITLQDYGRDSIPSFLEITDEKGKVQNINIKNIQQLRRKPNKDYKEVRKISINEVDVFFNKKLILPLSTAKDKRGHIFFAEKLGNKALVVAKDGKLVVQLKDTPTNHQCILLKVTQQRVGKELVYAFTYEDLITNACIPASSTVEPENALTNTYQVTEGVYAFYHPSTGQVNCCEIVVNNKE